MSAKKATAKRVYRKKIKYIECPFCHQKHTQRIGRDETSSWCSVCGKCFAAIWKEGYM